LLTSYLTFSSKNLLYEKLTYYTSCLNAWELAYCTAWATKTLKEGCQNIVRNLGVVEEFYQLALRALTPA